MLANREGLFHAYPVEIGLDEQGNNNLACYTIRFAIFEEFQNGQWIDVLSENMDITGWFYLETKDGRTNDFTIDALKSAFGWDGRDPFWLQDSAEALREHPVQLKLAFEEYNGNANLKVQYLNPYGSTGGGSVSQANDATRRNIANRLGSKFRATAGGRPLDTARGRPSPAPKPADPPIPPQPKSAPAGATMNEAWAEFVKHCDPAKWSQQAVEKEWFRIIADLFDGRQANDLTPADWGRMKAEGPGMIIPF
jgi:hypothetical protein